MQIHQVKETLQREKRPNVRTFSLHYRDPEADRELVWRMSCLWVASFPTQVLQLSAADRAIKAEKFYQGGMDEDLKPKVRVMDPSFVFEDLRFIREEMQSRNHGATGLSDADSANKLQDLARSKALSELEIFKHKLNGEGVHWAEWRLDAKKLEDSESDAIQQHQEAALAATEKAVHEHANVFYSTGCYANFSSVPTHMDAALNAITNFTSSRRPDDIFRLEVVNTSAMGPQYSVNLKDIGAKVSASLRGQYTRAAALVILPNCPGWWAGAGGTLTPAALDAVIAEAQTDVVAEFLKPEHAMEVRRIVGLYDTTSLTSRPDRTLPLQMLMCVSAEKDATGKLMSLWAHSTTWRRHAVSALLPCRPRSEYQDWTRAMGTGTERLDSSLERRQWHSGEDFYADLFAQVLSRVPMSGRDLCMIKDWCFYEDSMARGIMKLIMKKSESLPGLAYTGATWKAFIRPGAGEAVEANVACSVRDALAFHLKEKRYEINGFVLKEARFSASRKCAHLRFFVFM